MANHSGRNGEQGGGPPGFGTFYILEGGFFPDAEEIVPKGLGGAPKNTKGLGYRVKRD